MNIKKTITYDIGNPCFGLGNGECIFSRKGSHIQNVYSLITIIGAHQNRTPGTLKIKSVVPCLSHHIWNELNCKNMSFFLNISTFMDIKLLHPV